MKKRLKLEYIALIIVAVFGIASLYIIMNHSRVKINKQIDGYSRALSNYVTETCYREIDRNKKLLDCFSHDSIFDNDFKNIVAVTTTVMPEYLEAFNVLCEHPKNSYMLFKDGSHLETSDTHVRYLHSYDVFNEKFYIKVKENASFTTIPYENTNGDGFYAMAAPLFDKDKNFIGTLARTGDFDWLLDKLSKISPDDFKTEMVVESISGDLIAIVNKDEVIKNTGENLLGEEANRIKKRYDKNRGRTFENEELGVRVIIVPNTNELTFSYQMQILYVYIIAIIVFIIFVFIIIKVGENIKRDLTIIGMILLLFVYVNFFSFKNTYSQIAIHTMKIEIETNNIEKIERQANEYIDLYFLASNMFSRLDTNMKLSRTKLDFEKVAEIIKRDELHSLYKEVIRYLESNNEMFVLLPNNKKIILNDMSETYFDEDDIKIYNECLDYNSVYYSTSLPSQWPVATGLTFVPYTNQLDIVRTYRLKLNNAYNIIVGVRYNGSMADSDAILRRVYNNVITEGYILMTENGKAKITQLRRNKFETVKTVNGIAEVTLDNDEIVSLIDNIRKQSDKPSAYIALSHDAKERYAVAVNTGDTNILKLFFVDYDDILFLEHKTKEIIRRIIILYVIMLIGVLGLEKNREKNEKKREAIILHNNY